VQRGARAAPLAAARAPGEFYFEVVVALPRASGWLLLCFLRRKKGWVAAPVVVAHAPEDAAELNGEQM
jgi:hypothetical protein